MARSISSLVNNNKILLCLNCNLFLINKVCLHLSKQISDFVMFSVKPPMIFFFKPFESEHVENCMTIIRFCVFTESQFQFNLIIYSVARDQITWKLWGLISLVIRCNLISVSSDMSWQPSKSGLLHWQCVVVSLVYTAILSARRAGVAHLFPPSTFSSAWPPFWRQVFLRIGKLKDLSEINSLIGISVFLQTLIIYTWPLNYNNFFI